MGRLLSSVTLCGITLDLGWKMTTGSFLIHGQLPPFHGKMLENRLMSEKAVC